MPHRHLAVIVPTIVAIALAAWAYFVRESGVAGTPGALITLVGAVLVLIGAVLAGYAGMGRGGRVTFEVLVLIGLVLCAVSAWFLLQYWLTIAFAVALVGWLIAVIAPAPKRKWT